MAAMTNGPMIIGLCGLARSGKNTTARIMKDDYQKQGLCPICGTDNTKCAVNSPNFDEKEESDKFREATGEDFELPVDHMETVEVAFADALRAWAKDINPFFPELGKYYNDLIEEHGYEGAKELHPCVRAFLVKIGGGGRKHCFNRIWIQTLDVKLKALLKSNIFGVVFITDVRYKNEISYILDLGGTVYYIDNPRVEPANPEEERSFKELLEAYSGKDGFVVIKNDKDMEDLRLEVVKLQVFAAKY